MSRRTMHWALLVLGIIILVATVVASLIIRASDTATLALPETPAAPAVVTEPGVLDVVASEVTIRADVEGEGPVVLAVGRTEDVEAWLGDAEHERVTGLSSWEELTVETVTPEPSEPDDGEAATDDAADADADADAEEPEPGQLPDPAGSDLWVAEAGGDGEAELTWQDRPGRWSLVAATDGRAAAPQIELEWGRERTTPWLLPGLLVGALLALIGGGLLVVATLARREQQRGAQRRARHELDWQPGAEAVALPLVNPATGERYTRRELRQMQQAAADAEAVDRAVDDDAPPIPAPDDLGVGDPGLSSADPVGGEDTPEGDMPAADGPTPGVAEHDEPDDGEPGDGQPGHGEATTAAIDEPLGATRGVSGALGEQGTGAVSPTSPQSPPMPRRPSDESPHEPDDAHVQTDPPADPADDAPPAGAEAQPRRGWWARLFGSRQASPDDGTQVADDRAETADDRAETDADLGDDDLAGGEATTEPSGVALSSPGAQRSAPTPAGPGSDVGGGADAEEAASDVAGLDGADPAAGVTDPEPEPTDLDDDLDEDDASRSPSWRSVWGFGQPAPQPADPEDPSAGPHNEGHNEGEEQR